MDLSKGFTFATMKRSTKTATPGKIQTHNRVTTKWMPDHYASTAAKHFLYKTSIQSSIISPGVHRSHKTQFQMKNLISHSEIFLGNHAKAAEAKKFAPYPNPTTTCPMTAGFQTTGTLLASQLTTGLLATGSLTIVHCLLTVGPLTTDPLTTSPDIYSCGNWYLDNLWTHHTKSPSTVHRFHDNFQVSC